MLLAVSASMFVNYMKRIAKLMLWPSVAWQTKACYYKTVIEITSYLHHKNPETDWRIWFAICFYTLYSRFFKRIIPASPASLAFGISIIQRHIRPRRIVRCCLGNRSQSVPFFFQPSKPGCYTLQGLSALVTLKFPRKHPRDSEAIAYSSMSRTTDRVHPLQRELSFECALREPLARGPQE